MAKKIFILLLFFLFLSVLLFFHFRGIVYYDEGYILNSALRIVHGQIPYRDFDVVYTPLSFLTVSFFLKIFGESIFAGRLAALTISVLSLFALYQILKHIPKNTVLILLSLLFFIGWGPAHINFPWPTMFAICFFLYTILFYLQGIKKSENNYFYLSGIMTVVLFLAKQNFGIGIFFVFGLVFLFQKIDNKKIKITYFFYGFLSASFITIVIMLKTNSLYPFFENLYTYTFQRILVYKTLDTPFIYEGTLIIKLIKLLFYASPLIVSVFAFYYAIKLDKKLLILPCAYAVFYIVGIRPTTDYNHFVPLLATAVLPYVMIISLSNKKSIRILFFSLFTVLLILGFHTAYFKEYYKWDAALKEQKHFVNNPRFHIYLNQQRKEESTSLINYIDANTKPTDYIFVNYYAPIVYFLADRKNPTRYDLVSPNDTPENYQKIMIEELQKKNVTLVVMIYLNENENSTISNYVRKNYLVRKRIGGFVVFTKTPYFLALLHNFK